ncbi:MAG: hypothetical protein Q9172_004859 [Xanthocarpia lactea]
MDLVAGVRKEGSRGGRDAFKWEDVKDDQHRENYLGHSLMAPVGRWQKNKDLSWYAKGDDSQAATDAAKARAEEIRRIKEAEQDALSEALGYPVQPRLRDSQLAGQKEVEKALKETAEGDEGGKGVGFGNYLEVMVGIWEGWKAEVTNLRRRSIGDGAAGVQDGMSGEKEAGVGIDIERKTEKEIGSINIVDIMIVDERRMTIAGITGDIDHDRGRGTRTGGRLETTLTHEVHLQLWLFNVVPLVQVTLMYDLPRMSSTSTGDTCQDSQIRRSARHSTRHDVHEQQCILSFLKMHQLHPLAKLSE